MAAIARFANGDARAALNLLEFSAAAAPEHPATLVRQLDLAQLEQSIQRRALLYDKGGEEHYNLISALHKSMRNSDPDAAVYWVARMLEAGEDPLYIARRLIRFASEDVGNADPQALTVAVAAKDAAHFIGMPEGNNALAQAAIYLATAPKSNAVYTAYSAAAADAHQQAAEPVPLHLRNAPTKLMKQLEYGKGYQYAHEEARGDRRHGLPAALAGRAEILPPDRAGVREGDQAAAGGVGEDQEKGNEPSTEKRERRVFLSSSRVLRSFARRNVSGTGAVLEHAIVEGLDVERGALPPRCASSRAATDLEHARACTTSPGPAR